MPNFLKFILLVLLGNLLKTGEPAPDSDSDTDLFIPDTGFGDADMTGGPCQGGSWGEIRHHTRALHVRTSGNDGFNGTEQFPFATIDRALQEAANRQAAGDDWMYIALGPGDFVDNISIDIPIGVRIEGCACGETRVRAAAPDQAVFTIQPANDVILAGIEIANGDYGVVVDDALAALDNTCVAGSTRIGVHAQGDNGRIRLIDSQIRDITCEDGSGCGWGLSARGAEVDLIDSTIERATEFGLVTYFSDVRVDGSTIKDTRRNTSLEYGRAAQLQVGKQQLTNATFTNNHDVAVNSMRPDELIVGNIAIDITGIGLHNRGDNLVVSGRAGYTHIDLEASSFSGATRAPVLLQNLDATLTGNTLTSNGLGNLFYLQGSVNVTGSDGGITITFNGLDVDGTVIRPPEL